MSKISVIGAGSVGATVANDLMIQGVASEIVLVDVNKKKALGESIYVAAVYSDGTSTYSTGVLGYSIDAYCQAMIGIDSTIDQLAQSVVVYGDYAKSYFAELMD